MDNGIIELADEIALLYEEAYAIYNPQVKMIISNNIKDSNYIEHTLDYVMDIYTEKGFYLFLELCLYYSKIDYKSAKSYLNIFKEQRCEEYQEFVKKYQR